MLQTAWTDDLDGLLAAPGAAERWDLLAGGVPFRQANWLHAWWTHCGKDAVAKVLTVCDEDRNLVAALPLYQRPDDRSPQTLRSIGDGKACSDHITLLLDPEWVGGRDELIHAVADHLIDSSKSRTHGWLSIVMDGVMEDDKVMNSLVARIRQYDGIVHATSRMHAWYRRCEGSFDDYLKTFSRSSRGKQKRMLKSMDKWSDPVVDEPSSVHDMNAMLSELIDLHQVRWTEAGETGSFDQPCFRSFIHDTAERFGESGKLWIVGLREEGKLVSAAMSIIGGDNRAYCYCTGTDMHSDGLQAGKVLTLKMIEMAHQRGLAGIDFLRGDEEYKRRLHAQPTKVMELRIASPGLRSRFNHTAWLAAFETKQMIRKGLGRRVVHTVNTENNCNTVKDSEVLHPVR